MSIVARLFFAVGLCLHAVVGYHTSSLRTSWEQISTRECSFTPPNLTSLGLSIKVDRITEILGPAEALDESGHAFAFADGSINVLVRSRANTSNAVRSVDGGHTWTLLPKQVGRSIYFQVIFMRALSSDTIKRLLFRLNLFPIALFLKSALNRFRNVMVKSYGFRDLPQLPGMVQIMDSISRDK